MYRKLTLAIKGMEQFNVFNNDEVIFDRESGALPGELAVISHELNKFYGIYEGRDKNGYEALRFLDGCLMNINPREGWTRVGRVVAVFRRNVGGLEEVMEEVVASARRRKISPTLNLDGMAKHVTALGVFIESNKVWTTSSDVADWFGKPHNDVLKAIRALDCSQEFCEGNFSLTSQTVAMPKGGTRKVPQYLMTRDGFTFLAMGFTGPKAAHFKELYIAEFNRMEEELYRRRFCGASSKEEPVLELPLERTTFSPVLLPEPPKEDYATELQRRYEWEKKRAATAIGNLKTARTNEEKMRHQLNKALDVIAKLVK